MTIINVVQPEISSRPAARPGSRARLAFRQAPMDQAYRNLADTTFSIARAIQNKQRNDARGQYENALISADDKLAARLNRMKRQGNFNHERYTEYVDEVIGELRPNKLLGNEAHTVANKLASSYKQRSDNYRTQLALKAQAEARADAREERQLQLISLNALLNNTQQVLYDTASRYKRQPTFDKPAYEEEIANIIATFNETLADDFKPEFAVTLAEIARRYNKIGEDEVTRRVKDDEVSLLNAKEASILTDFEAGLNPMPINLSGKVKGNTVDEVMQSAVNTLYREDLEALTVVQAEDKVLTFDKSGNEALAALAVSELNSDVLSAAEVTERRTKLGRQLQGVINTAERVNNKQIAEETSQVIKNSVGKSIELIKREINSGRLNDEQAINREFDKLLSYLNVIDPQNDAVAIREEIEGTWTGALKTAKLYKIDTQFKPAIDEIVLNFNRVKDEYSFADQEMLLERMMQDASNALNLTPEQFVDFSQAARMQVNKTRSNLNNERSAHSEMKARSALGILADRQLANALEGDEEEEMEEFQQVLDQLPTLLQEELDATIVQPAILKNNQARHEAEVELKLTAQRELLATSQTGRIDLIVGDPTTLATHRREYENELNASDLPQSEKNALLAGFHAEAATASIRGSAKQIFNLPEKDREGRRADLLQAINSDPAFNILENDKQRIFDRAVAEAELEFDEASEAAVDAFIQTMNTQTTQAYDAMLEREDLTVEDKARLTTAWSKYIDAGIQERSFMEKLADPNYLFRASDKEQFLEVWNEQKWSEQFFADDEFAFSQLPRIAARLNGLSGEVIQPMMSAVYNGDSAVANRVLGFFNRLDNQNAQALANSLSDDQMVQYQVWKDLAVYQSDEQALAYVRSLQNDPAVRRLRMDRINEFRQERRESGLENFVDLEEITRTLKVHKAPKDSLALHSLLGDFNDLVETYYGMGGNLKDAKRKAVESLKQNWGENINGDLMYYPPAVSGYAPLYNPNTDRADHNWINKNLRNQLNSMGFPLAGKEFELHAIPQTLQAKESGQDAPYYVRYRNDDGLYDYVMDENKNPIAFTFEFDEQLQKEQKEAFERIKKGQSPRPPRGARGKI